MTRKYNSFSIIRSVVFIAILLASSTSSAVRAINGVYDPDFYQSNGIYYYHPGDAANCVISQGTTTSSGGISNGNGANGNKDYAGNTIIPNDQMEKIKKFQPIYEEAAKKENIPWQIFAVIHIRESVLADFNPDNGQGVYQDYERGGNGGQDYPPGPVDDAELLRQTIYAGTIVKEKAGDKFSLLQKGDADAIKDMFFGYNGRAAGYVEQAKSLGFTEGYEGSPYVMNRADQKRDPTVEPTKSNGTWGQVKVDNGPIGYPANGDYGAYVMYAALAGVPATTGGCTSGSSIDPRVGANGWEVSGPNAMQVYYQIDEPWASTVIDGYDIRSYGCGPTSLSMIMATLNKDTSITPKNMAEYLNSLSDPGGKGWDNQGLHFFPLDDGSLAQKYGVSVTSLGTDISKVSEALKRGSFVLMSADGGILAPLGGHILVLRGMTGQGNFLVANPASHEQTEDANGFSKDQVMGSLAYGFWEIRK